MAARQKTSLLDLQNYINSAQGRVIYLTGEEEFFVEESLHFIRNTILQAESVDFNYDLFYARDTEASRIFDVVETLPMMSTQRLVILRNAHELRESDWKMFLPAIENPVDSTYFILTGKKLDGRKAIIKSVQKNLKTFDFQKPYENEYPRWIQYLCKKHGVEMDGDAIALSLQIIGPQLLELQSEIIKMGQYIGDRKVVTSEDVMTVASKIKLQSVFDLTKAIGECDRALALMCLATLLEGGQNEVGILAMVHRHIRLLRQTKSGEEQGFRGRELSTFAGIPHFYLTEYLKQARLWNERKIEKTYKVLADTDRALKSSPISSHIWLENFILQTCG